MLISSGDADQAAETTRRAAVVVLGVGRSGTSAITRGLGALGIELGDRLRSPTLLKNPTGFYEDRDLLRINKRLKSILGVRGESVRLLEPEWWMQPAVKQLQVDAVAIVRRRFGGCPLWGYKYARTLRFMPFWMDVFAAADVDARYLMAIRNPLSVARSRARLDPRRGTQEQSDLEWLVNVVPYFRRVREYPLVVVDFDLFIADPTAQLERIARGLRLSLGAETRAALRAYSDEFLDPRLRHSRHDTDDLNRDLRVNGLTRTAYRWLYRLAVDAVDPRSPEFWQEWQQIEDQLSALAPVLRHIDHVADNLRRARWSPLGPLQSIPWLWHELRRRWPAG
jgi:hypothetical protein